MKSILPSLAIAGLSAGAAFAQVNPGYTRESATLTPNNLFTRQSMNANLPLTGGMDVFPDGRVALVEWGNPGSVFILSGLDKGSNVQVTRFATGLDNAMGLKIVDNVIYVMEKEALTQLVDTDGDGVADQYNSINESFPSDNGMLNFSYDLGYLKGSFYAAMSSDVHIGGLDWGSGQYPGTTALAGRSTLYKLNTDGTSSAYACGFRNPNGMWTNGEDLFVTDNQGSWLPSSKVINIKQGRFYGHRTNPANACQTANNNTESPPVAWSNYGDGDDATGRSWGNGVVLSQGLYAGQMLVGETVQDHPNKVVRVFTETVGGELQGCLFPFVKGGINGVFRIKEGPNGRIYLGEAGSSGYWAQRSGMTPGLDVLVPNGKVPFDVLAIRNLGNNSFDVQFTKAVGTSAGQTGNYKARMWQNNPVEAYGGGNMQNPTNLTISSAAVSTDKMHVTLTINGLQAGRVVKFNFSNITADDGTALFPTFALYTLNKFGPGTDYKYQAPATAVAKRPEAGWKLVAGNGSHFLQFPGYAAGPKDVAVYDLSGAKRLELRGVSGAEVRLETAGLRKGMYLIRVQGANANGSGTLIVP